jgi:hypothetical protein
MNAYFSPCNQYRYRLERAGAGEGTTAVIMINPSWATADWNDPTINKVIGFGQRYGWGNIVVGNLFGYRSENVRQLEGHPDPVGPENDAHLAQIIEGADRVIFAWGSSSKFPRGHEGRWKAVQEAVLKAGKQPLCLGAPLIDGHPPHPGRISYAEAPRPWTGPK